jgi:hypothetical protein
VPYGVQREKALAAGGLSGSEQVDHLGFVQSSRERADSKDMNERLRKHVRG